MARSEFRKAPGYIEHQDNPEIMGPISDCEQVGDVHFCGATSFQIGMRTDGKTGATHIAVLVAKRGYGYVWQLTCHGGREIGQRLIDMADRLEAQQAEQARQQLAATLGKGKL